MSLLVQYSGPEGSRRHRGDEGDEDCDCGTGSNSSVSANCFPVELQKSEYFMGDLASLVACLSDETDAIQLCQKEQHLRDGWVTPQSRVTQ